MRRTLIVLLLVAVICGGMFAAASACDSWKGIPAVLRLEARLERLNGAECATEILMAATVSRQHQFEVHIRCDRKVTP